jgi:hypothetical protein
VGWTTKKKLVVVEVVYFIVDGAVLMFYWYGVFAAVDQWLVNLAVGLLFTAQFVVSGISTYLWFVRTDEGDPYGSRETLNPEPSGSSSAAPLSSPGVSASKGIYDVGGVARPETCQIPDQITRNYQ